MSTMEGLTARGARKTVSTDDYAEPATTLSVSGGDPPKQAPGLRIPHPPLQPCPTCWVGAGGSLKSHSQHMKSSWAWLSAPPPWRRARASQQ